MHHNKTIQRLMKEEIGTLSNKIDYLKRQEKMLQRNYKIHKYHERSLADKLSEYA